MSAGMTALSSIGITHEVLILGVSVCILVGIIGMFAQYIIPGAIIVAAALLFYEPPNATNAEQAKDSTKQEEVFDEQQAFMKDCIEVAEYSRDQCRSLWNQGPTDTKTQPTMKNVKLLDVDNEEYKMRRASALTKPNAVVIHETLNY